MDAALALEDATFVDYSELPGAIDDIAARFGLPTVNVSRRRRRRRESRWCLRREPRRDEARRALRGLTPGRSRTSRRATRRCASVRRKEKGLEDHSSAVEGKHTSLTPPTLPPRRPAAPRSTRLISSPSNHESSAPAAYSRAAPAFTARAADAPTTPSIAHAQHRRERRRIPGTPHAPRLRRPARQHEAAPAVR